MALPEIRLMQSAIALAEDLNFSRAAERLHISQPTLSKQILELESQLGFRLFERTHQIVELTDAGRMFVAEAREAVLHAERAVMEGKAAFNGADEILNIGKSPYADPYLVSILLSLRLPLFPGLRIKLWSDYSHELARQVIAGTLDIALITGVPDASKLSVLKVEDNNFYLAMTVNDDLTANCEVHLNDIHDRNWILLGRHANPHLYDMIQLVASGKGVRASDIHHVLSPEEASELVREHNGLAFLPPAGAWRIASDGITMRPLVEDQLRLITNLAVRSNSKSRLVNEFVRAAGRKLSNAKPTIQRKLTLTT